MMVKRCNTMNDTEIGGDIISRPCSFPPLALVSLYLTYTYILYHIHYEAAQASRTETTEEGGLPECELSLILL